VRAAVADTSPLNYLVLIGAIDVLPRLFEAVIVPGAVKAELLHVRAPAAVRRWAAAPPLWLRVAHALPPAGAGLDHLDAGERAVIALALSLQPDFVLIDERAGVAAARAQGLEVLGTLGLLDRAARAGLIDLGGAVAALKATNFHARQSLFDALLARHQKRQAP
jgi:predicted nucleic acid-binding protein